MAFQLISGVKALFSTGALAVVSKGIFNFGNNTDFKKDMKKAIADINAHHENSDKQIVEMGQAILKLQTENTGFYREVRDGFGSIKIDLDSHEKRDEGRHEALVELQNKMLDILLKR